MKKISIYHTNDIHSNFDKLAGISSFLHNNRTTNDLYFDAGDLLDFSSTTVYGTCGKSGLKLMEYLHCDALCLGNNESFTGKEKLEFLLSDKEIPILSANLRLSDSNDIKGLLSHIFIERLGYKFLVIGVNPFFNKNFEETYNNFYNLCGLNSCNPIIEITKLIEKSSNYDFVVLLSHSGINVDQHFAKSISELDIIIGGHSHSTINDNYKINDCIITQSGSYGNLIGKLDLYIEDNKIVNFNNINIENNFIQDEKFLELLRNQETIANNNLNKTIKNINYFEFSFDGVNCSLMRFLCDSVKEEYISDLCIINNGIFNNNLNGNITKKKLLESCPSPLNPTRVYLSGAKINEEFIKSKNSEYSLKEIRGPGFRGKILGTLSFSSNVKIIDDIIYIDGEIIDNNKVYNVLTSDFLQRGYGYESFLKTDDESTFYPLYFYEIVEKYISK